MSIVTYVLAAGVTGGTVNPGDGSSFNVGTAIAGGGGQFTVDDQINPLLVRALDSSGIVVRSGVTPGTTIQIPSVSAVTANSAGGPLPWQTGLILSPNTIVSNAGSQYLCNTFHIAGASFDATKFTALGGAGGGGITSFQGRTAAAATLTKADVVGTALAAADISALATGQNLADLGNPDLARANLAMPELAAAKVVATANIASLSGLPTIDGYTLQSGDRIHAVAQTTGSQNGPWLASSGAWVRPSDYPAGRVITARTIYISGGAINGGTVWGMIGTASITIDTTATVWSNLSAAILASPTITGTPTAPTPPLADNSSKLATTAYIDTNRPRAALTADLTAITATTALQSITALQLNIGASATEIWVVEWWIMFNTANATMDIKFGINTFPTGVTARGGPSGVNTVNFGGWGTAATASTPTALGTQATTFSTGSGANITGISYLYVIYGGGTAGAVVPGYAQATSDAGTLQVLKGSFMHAEKLAA